MGYSPSLSSSIKASAAALSASSWLVGANSARPLSSSIFINTHEEVSFPKEFNVYKADLTGIALRENLVVAGSPILNTPVIGALAKLGLFSRESGVKAITETFADPRNTSAARAAYEEVIV